MPSIFSWMKVTFSLPIWLAPLLVIGLGVLIYWMIRQMRKPPVRIEVKVPVEVPVEVKVPVYVEVPVEAGPSQEQKNYLTFISNVSHDIANPLQSIKTNLDNLEDCKIDETAHQYQARMSSEIQRLIELTTEVRLLARLDSPDQARRREPVNFKAVVEDVIMALYERAEHRHIELCVEGPSRVPVALGDRGQLTQALMNLVENAIKYSKDSGGTITISLLPERNQLKVMVMDQGIGIAPEDLKNIFDNAYRAHSPGAQRRSGTGLGLTLVKRIIEQHGGQVWVESAVGQGSSFIFTLPVYLPQA